MDSVNLAFYALVAALWRPTRRVPITGCEGECGHHNRIGRLCSVAISQITCRTVSPDQILKTDKDMLEIRNLHARIAETGTEIIRG